MANFSLVKHTWPWRCADKSLACFKLIPVPRARQRFQQPSPGGPASTSMALGIVFSQPKHIFCRVVSVLACVLRVHIFGANCSWHSFGAFMAETLVDELVDGCDPRRCIPEPVQTGKLSNDHINKHSRSAICSTRHDTCMQTQLAQLPDCKYATLAASIPCRSNLYTCLHSQRGPCFTRLHNLSSNLLPSCSNAFQKAHNAVQGGFRTCKFQQASKQASTHHAMIRSGCTVCTTTPETLHSRFYHYNPWGLPQRLRRAHTTCIPFQ